MKKRTAIFLVGAAVFYWLCRRAFFVGFFNDDAFFIIGARSLLQGRFVELNQPGFPPMVHYPPGYPLLLTLVGWIPTKSFVPYQVVSMALVVAALFFYESFSRLRGDVSGEIVLVLTALSPQVVSMSGTVMSDIAYFAVSMLILLIVEGWSDRMSNQRLVILSLLCAYCFYVRPIGAVFALAVALLLLSEHRWKGLFFFGGVFILSIFPYLVRNQLSRGHWLPIAAEYGSHFGSASGSAHIFASSWSNAVFYLREGFVRNLFRWHAPLVSQSLEFLTILSVFFFSLIGIFRANFSGWKKLPWIYLFFYSAVLLAWDRQCSRYLLPIVPLFLSLFLGGVHVCESRIFRKPVLTGAFFSLALFLYFPTLKTIFNVSQNGHTRLNTPAERTFEWVRKNTKPEDVFTTEWDGQFFLYTGHQCFHLPKLSDRGAFAHWAKSNRGTYVLLSPVDMIVKTNSGNLAYEPLPADLAKQLVSDEGTFEKVFEDDGEGTIIYRLRAPNEI